MSNRNSIPNPYQQHHARIQRTTSTSSTSAATAVAAAATNSSSLPPPRPFFVGDDDQYTTDTDSDREIGGRPTNMTTAANSIGSSASRTPIAESMRRRGPPPSLLDKTAPVTAPRPARGRVMHSRRASGSSQLASSSTHGVEEVPRTSSPVTHAAGVTSASRPSTNPSSDESETPGTTSSAEGAEATEQSGKWTPTSLYNEPQAQQFTPTSLIPTSTSRPPPSAFPFPFQAYAGNPDPGTSIPGLSRRYSFDLNQNRRTSVDSDISMQGSLTNGGPVLGRPYAPFMTGNGSSASLHGSNSNLAGGYANLPTSGSSSSLYRQSAAGAMSALTSPQILQQQQLYDANGNPVAVINGQQLVFAGGAAPGAGSVPGTPNPNGTSTNGASLPRNSSAQSFRAPFLSPASRPTSSLWSPPSYPQLPHFPPSPNPNGKEGSASPSESTANLGFLHYPYPPKPSKKVLPSTRLAAPLTKADKPWLKKKDFRTRLSYWSTLFCIFLGAAGAGVLCFFGITSVNTLPQSSLCMVLNEDFGGGIDTDGTWNQINSISGFGSNFFHIASDSSTNTFIRNGQLYINPTLTSQSPDSGLNADQVAAGSNYTVPNCSEQSSSVRQGNRTVTVAGVGCGVSSNNARGTVINPVMSGKLTTMGKKEIRYGKVEIRAKLPQGATTEAGAYYGPFEATRDSAGNAFTASQLTPSFLAPLSTSVSGALTMKRSLLNEGFHTYVVEWTPEWIRWYVDGRVTGKIGEVQLVTKGFGTPKGHSMFELGKFPKTAKNGSTEVVVENPWASGGPSAPFDQPFYLGVELAVGGTSGYFPDNLGNKPWFDGSETAMRDFLNAQDEWYSTWPENEDSRAFRIDSVKMWKICNID
ncbi:hypothetical protein ONZ45_g11829 [Pleurotus djamor]|nr:hypothetical protein ONZ45_g11829 [Pleurotus djamor]